MVGLEPSCLLTLRDEFQSLLPGDDSANLAKRAVLIGEFLANKTLPLKDTAVIIIESNDKGSHDTNSLVADPSDCLGLGYSSFGGGGVRYHSL
mgnify:CR=1 FL=1